MSYTPHPSSVIDISILGFNESLYYKLIEMEDYTYSSSERPKTIKSSIGSTTKASIDEYKPFWISLNEAIVRYITHSPMEKGTIKDMISALYCHEMIKTKGFGNENIASECDAKILFNIDGYIDNVLSYPVNHYDDFIALDPSPLSPEPDDPKEDLAPNIQIDIEHIVNAWDKDVASVKQKISEVSDLVSDYTTVAMFNNKVTTSGTTMSLKDTHSLIFDTLNWRWYIEYFKSTISIPEAPIEETSSTPF